MWFWKKSELEKPHVFTERANNYDMFNEQVMRVKRGGELEVKESLLLAVLSDMDCFSHELPTMKAILEGVTSHYRARIIKVIDG